MREVTEKFVKEVNELKDLGIKALMANVDFMDIDATGLEFMQRSLRLLDTSCEIMLRQATVMDDISRKMDILVKRGKES